MARKILHIELSNNHLSGDYCEEDGSSRVNYRGLEKVGLNILYLFAFIILYFSTFVLTTIPAQLLLVSLFLLKPLAPRKVYLYLTICVTYLFCVISINPSDIPLRNLLFYFSFVMPFLVMLSAKDSVNQFVITDGFIAAVCAVTIAEAIIINSPLATHVWFSSVEGDKEHPARALLGLFRPLGVAGRASSSGALVVFSLVLSDMLRTRWTLFCKRNFFAALTLIVIASGTGFMMFIIYLAIRLSSYFLNARRTGLISGLSLTCIFILLLWGASGGLVLEKYNRFSFEYAISIIEHKSSLLTSFEAPDFVELLLGGQVSPTNPILATTTDFGYLGMFSAIGALGGMLILSAPLLFFRALRFFAVPTIFFYLCFIHYPALSSPPGAVLFALYLYMLSSYDSANRRRVKVVTRRENFAQ